MSIEAIRKKIIKDFFQIKTKEIKSIFREKI